MNWKFGLVIAGAIIWGAFLLNQGSEPVRMEPELDRYSAEAARLQAKLLRDTYDLQIRILTLEAMGYGMSQSEALQEARDQLAAEISYHRDLAAELLGQHQASSSGAGGSPSE